MIKRLSLLNGLAIITVVMNHAVGWTFTGMFWWTDQYRAVTVPNFDQVGSPAYYLLVIIEQLALFSVPAFLFVSGFFAAYASRAERQGLGWSFVRTRVIKLFWPYAIWSIVIFIFGALQGNVLPPLDYVGQLLTGGATGAYYFVPLLIQFYLLAPFICKWGKDRPVLLLTLAAVIQLGALGLTEMRLGGTDIPEPFRSASWLFIWYALYFPLGVVIGFRSKAIQDVLARWKWALTGLTVIFGVLSVLESEWLFQHTQIMGWAQNPVKISSALYAVTFILAFMAFSGSRGRFWNFLNSMGGRSYGIYLVHPLLLEIISRLIRRVTPNLLAQPLLFFAILVSGSIAIVVAMMISISRTRARAAYHYLFG